MVFIACEFLFSVLFFWPRNEIMFVEGTAVHSAEALRQTALRILSDLPAEVPPGLTLMLHLSCEVEIIIGEGSDAPHAVVHRRGEPCRPASLRGAAELLVGLLVLGVLAGAARPLGAQPALACGGLVGPGGTGQLARTTTLGTDAGLVRFVARARSAFPCFVSDTRTRRSSARF